MNQLCPTHFYPWVFGISEQSESCRERERMFRDKAKEKISNKRFQTFSLNFDLNSNCKNYNNFPNSLFTIYFYSLFFLIICDNFAWFEKWVIPLKNKGDFSFWKQCLSLLSIIKQFHRGFFTLEFLKSIYCWILFFSTSLCSCLFLWHFKSNKKQNNFSLKIKTNFTSRSISL